MNITTWHNAEKKVLHQIQMEAKTIGWLPLLQPWPCRHIYVADFLIQRANSLVNYF